MTNNYSITQNRQVTQNILRNFKGSPSLLRWLFVMLLVSMSALIANNASAQLVNVPISGASFNNDIVANGVGATNTVSTGTLPGVSQPTIGIDGNGPGAYSFIDATYQWYSGSSLPTCFLPTGGAVASALTPGLTYQLQSYSANNALTIASNTYTGSVFPTTGSLALSPAASYTKLYVLYETVLNTTGPFITATVTFSDASTQVFSGNSIVNWFTATGVAYTPTISRAQNAAPGAPGSCTAGTGPFLFEMQLSLLPTNWNKTVSSITFGFSQVVGTAVNTVDYFHALAVGGLTPCPIPVDQATALTQGATTTTTIAGSFTAAGSSPSGYLVVGYLNPTLATNPVDGVTYTAGQSLGAGKVIQSSAATSFSASGLIGGTGYDVYVYSYNTGASCGGPRYNTSLFAYTIMPTSSCVGVAGGTYTVGPTGTYLTITDALTAVNAGISGPVILELQSTYLSSAEPSFPILFPSNSCIGPVNTLTIRPQTGATALSITSANATGTINFNGASYVTIDGRAGGVGVSQLTIANTNTGYAANFSGDAVVNTIKYCTVTSRNTSVTSGTISFGTGTVTGNDGNSIDNCSITNDGSATFPVNAIYSFGTSAAIDNSGNVISNNNISNYFSATLLTSGILLGATGNSGWTISNNKLFQTATRVYSTGNTHNGIGVLSGSGYTITGNTIGFSSAIGTGTTNLLGNSGALTSGTFPTGYVITTTNANTTRYIAINCAFTAAGTASEIQGNTIAGFALYSSSGANTTNGIWCGINVTSGNANIGNTSGNTIGSTSGLGSIYTVCSTTGGAAVGIYTTSANTVNIQNNTIGSVDATGTSAAISGAFAGIDGAGTGGNYIINGNTIGNATADNIRVGYTPSGANLSNAGTLTATTGATASMVGIRNTATGNTFTANSNTLRGWANSSTATSAIVTGITASGAMTGAAPSAIVNSNLLGTAALGWIRYSVANVSTTALTGISLTKTVATVSSVQSNDIRGIVYSVAASTNSHTYLTCTGGTAVGNTTTIANNTFTNLIVNTTGSITFISHSYSASATSIQTINNNSIVTAFNKGGAGGTITLATSGSSSVAGAVINHTNNNFSNITVTGATTIAGWISSDGGTANKNYTNNTFSNWTGGTSGITAMSVSFGGGNGGNGNVLSGNTISTITGQGAITGISLGASGTTHTATGNTITGLSSTGTGGAVLGITSSAPTGNINNNNINTLSSTGTPVTALNITGGTTVNNSGNNIANISSSNASGVVNGVSVSGGTTVTISSDTIHTLTVSGATSPLVTGISVSGGTTVNLVKNKVCDLLASAAISTTAGAVKGIGLSAGTTVNAYNNLIGDLRAPLANLTDAIRGVSVTSVTAGGSYNVYDNTIFMNAASTGINFGTSGIFHTASATTTLAKLDLRNNIVINVSTPNSPGITSVLTRSTAATLGNYAITSNRNLYYAGTPSATRAFLNDGGTVYGTAAAAFAFGPVGTAGSFQNQVTSSREANSFTDASFVYTTAGSFFQSVICTDINYLHLVAGITTLVESGASVITTPAITDDYDGQTRNTSNPDIGADEFSGVSPAPAITNVLSNVALTSQCAATNRIISADVTTPAGTITSVVLNFAYNGTAQTPVNMTFVSGNTYTGTITAPTTPANATVTWSITATNSGSLFTTVNGTTYQDAPLTGVTATAVASTSPICFGGSSSLSVSLSTATIPAAPAASAYCASTHASGCSGDAITRVVLNTLDRTTGTTCGTTSAAYSNFSGLTGTNTTSLAGGTSYTINCTFGTDGNQYFGAWIDYNHDGVYASSEVLGLSGNAGASGTIGVTFTVPAGTAYNGLTHIRIVGGNDSPVLSTQSCGASSSGFGETQDYDVTITGALSAVPFSGSITAYSWFDGTSVVGITNPLVQSPTTTTSYTVTVTAANCPIQASTSVTVIPQAAAPTGTNSNQCGTGIPTASATALSGGILRWYFVPTGGAIQQNGGTTWTGSISTTTEFYVAEFGGTCEGARVHITAAVNSPDAVSASSSGSPTCPFTNLTLTATQTSFVNGNNYTYSWTSVSAGSGIAGSLAGGSGVTATTAPLQATTSGSKTYLVTATDGACVTTASVIVIISVPPNIDSIKAVPSSACLGQPSVLNVYSAGLSSGTQTPPTGYCATSGQPAGSTADDQIFRVTFGTMDNNQVETCASNYTDYTGTVAAPTITAGSTVSFLVRTNECDGATFWATGVSIFIDYNRDGLFTGTGEQVYTTNATLAPTGASPGGDRLAPPTGAGTITVPITALAGVTRMRVVCGESTAAPDPCTNYTFGETEDYLVNVIGVVRQDPAKTYAWSPAGGTSFTANVIPTATTTYTVAVNETGNACTNFASVTVTSLPIPVAPTPTNSSQACAGVPTASVAGAGGTFKWYDSASGGILLQTGGSTYATSIAVTTTFYVSETSAANCEGPRVAVTATVSADPVTASADANPHCLGGTVQLFAAWTPSVNTYTFNWTASPQAGSGLPIVGTPGQNITITPGASGTYIYTVTATDAGLGCSVTSTVSVTVGNPPPITGVTATPATICVGSSTTLAAGAGSFLPGTATVGTSTTTTQGGSPFRAGGGNAMRTQFLYTAAELTAAGLTSGNLTGITWTFTGGSGGTLPAYTVKIGTTTATALTGTFETSATTVVYGPLAVNPLTVAGDLTLPFSTVFAWNGTSNLLIEVCHGTPSPSAGSGTVSANTTGFVSVNQAINASGCTTVNGGLTQSIRPIVKLNGLVGTNTTTSFNWVWNPGSLSGSTVTASPASTTIYTVTATAPSSGCTATATTTVTVIPVPLAPVVAPASPTVCNNAVVTLTATLNNLANDIFWYNVATGGSVLSIGTDFETPILTHDSTFYAEENNGVCGGPRTAVLVHWIPAPSLVISNSDPVNCGGTINAELNVSSSNDPNYVYTWAPTDSLDSYTGGSLATTNITGSTVFTVTAVDAASGCTTSGTTTVTIFKFTQVNLSASPAVICPGSSSNISSGVSATAFSVSSIPSAPEVAPGSGITNLATGGAAVVAQTSGTLDDGGWGAIPIGFSFNFFGTNYTSVNVGTNGVLQFGAYNATEIAQFTFTSGIPSASTPKNIIATMACDLYLVNGGSLRYWINGTTPNRVFVVEYLNVPGFTANGLQNVQAILHETTGVIDIQVTQATSTAAKTIGAQDATTPTPQGSTAPGRNAFTGSIGAEGWRFQPPIVYTFAWTPNNGSLDNVTSGNPVATPTATTIYTVVVTDPVTLCQHTDTVRVTVNPVPNVPTIADTAICGPHAMVLTASGAGTGPVYRWYVDGTTPTILYTGNPYTTPILSASTSYFVSSFDLCESARTPVTVTYTDPGPFDAGADQTICRSDSAVLSVVTGLVDYDLFTWSPATGLSSTTGSTVKASPAATTTYTVVASSSTGLHCQNIDQVVVTVNQRPTITAVTASPNPVCAGDSTQLNVTAVPYISPGSNAASYLFSQTSGTYSPITGGTVVFTGALWDDGGALGVPLGFNFVYNGTTFTTVSVAANGYVTMGSTATTTTYCPTNDAAGNANVIMGYATDLHGAVAGSEVRYEILGSSPNQIFVAQWTTTMHFSGNTADNWTFQVRLHETSNAVDVVWGPTSTVTTNGDNNCSAINGEGGAVGITSGFGASANLRVVTPGTNTWLTSTAATTVSATNVAGMTSAEVPPAGLTFTWTPPGPSNLTYAWTPSATLSAGGLIQNPKSGATTATIYTVLVSETGTGCTKSGSVSVAVTPLPAPTITPGSATICEDGNFDQYAVDLTGPYSVANGGYPSGTKIEWIIDGFSTTPFLDPAVGVNTTGNNTFQVIVHLPLSLGSCASLPSALVTVDHHLLDINLAQPVINATCGNSNGKIKVNVNGTPPYNYIWSNGRNIHTTATSDSIVNLIGGNYTLTVIDNEGLVNPGISCSKTVNYDVISLGGPVPTITTVNHETCFGANDGNATISISGGTSPITILWSSGSTALMSDLVGPGTYTVTVTDVNLCANNVEVIIYGPAAALTGVTSFVQPTCNLSDGSISVVASGGRPLNNGGADYDYTWYADLYNGTLANIGTNNPTVSGVDTGTYYVVISDSNGTCSTTDTIIVTQSCEVDLDLSAWIEGYYQTGGSMNSPLLNSGVAGTGASDVDTIRVELRDQFNPGDPAVASAQAILHVDGTSMVVYPGSVLGGTYYIAVFHQNAVQTWSASPITFAATTIYDFRTASTQAFGDNMWEVESGVWAFYSGDMNQDEFVDVFDFPQYDEDNFNQLSGYYPTDLNGDGFVDVFDFPVYDKNNFLQIMSIHP